MKKSIKLLAAVTLVLFSAKLSADNPTQPKRITLSVGICSVTSEQILHHPAGDYFEKIPMASAEVKYEALKSIEIGGYLAYTNMSHGIPMEYKSEGFYVLIDSEGEERCSGNMQYCNTTSNTLFYGIMAQYDLLPSLTGKENLRFKLQVEPRIGLVSAQWNLPVPNDWAMSWNGPFIEYGIGLGAGYLFTKRFGISISCSMGQFYNNDNIRWYGGITYKL